MLFQQKSRTISVASTELRLFLLLGVIPPSSLLSARPSPGITVVSLRSMAYGAGIGSICHDYAMWACGLCGVNHIADAKTRKMRILWYELDLPYFRIIVFLFLLGFFLYELYIMVAKFFSYPTTVATTLLFSELVGNLG